MTKLIRVIGLPKILLAIIDFAVLMGIAASILFLRAHFLDNRLVLNEFFFFLVSSAGAILIFRELNLYRHRVFISGSDQVVLMVKGMLYVGILQIVAIFLIKDNQLIDYSRTNIIIYVFGGLIALAAYRLGPFREIYVRAKRMTANKRRVLAVGAGRAGQSLATMIQDQPELGLQLIGFLDDDPTKVGMRVLGLPIYGGIDRVVEMAHQLDAHEIYVAINETTYHRLLEIIEECRKTSLPVTITTDHFRIIPHRIGTNEFDYIESITLRPRDLENANWHLKRFSDIIGSTVLLGILTPLLLLIAFAVKISSPGPVLYRSKVVGRSGRLFTWYKFRTMSVDRDETVHREHLRKIIAENGSTQKLQNDTRVTFVGRLLRKYSVDELPQLYNVLRGEMSLIGPRPCLQYEYEHFDEWQKQRFLVTPGMTGLWQVVGRNKSDVTFNDSIILDLYYIQNYSVWLDLKIAIKTIPAVFFGRGGA
ncbi:MAG: sugar transferase [bacterium]|nr:sugar transferase [Candidatus Kapabacteria bacterium]